MKSSADLLRPILNMSKYGLTAAFAAMACTAVDFYDSAAVNRILIQLNRIVEEGLRGKIVPYSRFFCF